MLFATVLLVAAAAAAVSVRAFTFVDVDASAQVVEGEWMVVMDSVAMAERAALDEVAAQLKGTSYAIGATFRAVHVAGVTKEQLAAQLEPLSAAVSYVEPNLRVFALADECEEQGGEDSPVSWGQARTSDGEEPELEEFEYNPSNGDGTVSYIIDTGVYVQHQDFEDRARWGTNTIDNDDTDGNGHGTHVASTVGGKVWGIAKKTELVGVKVLSASGGGTVNSVVGGIQWASNDASGKKATGNMSLGGGKSTALNQATDAAVDAGMVMVVAGGNSNTDACNASPASADKAITAGSTDIGNNGGNQVDIRSYFSNYGSCTQIFAPGSDITAAWIGSPTATRTISGTSMASPHVCGVANALLSSGTSASGVLAKLQQDAHKDVIDLSCSNSACNASPNLLLHLECDD
mmetsp:Transcript_48671/g.119113  ORF Transcript_48671/g.119113 Transcript_48671/m.119113 type:complete len:405 (+) Transcript_48671:95-1309(+)